MKYLGSKNKYARELIPIILKNRKIDQWYVEPFVGGFNFIDKVPGKRIASYINKYLISLYIAIRDGWIPPSKISEEQYKDIKDNIEKYPDYLVGFVGFGCSFGGKWFGGYARGLNSKNQPRNYCLETKKYLLKQSRTLQDIDIRCSSYDQLDIPDNSIIYCDPPYQGTTKYNDEINHDKFWDWVRDMKNKGHEIFVSEYNAPDDFSCVWKKEVVCAIGKDNKNRIEKLFTLL